MAVARMQRVLIIGHADDAGAMTRSLQRAAVVHVQSTELVEGDREAERVRRLDAEHDDLADRLDDARFVKDLLGQYRTPPDRPLASFITEKFHLGLGEFETIDKRLNFDHLLSVCREAEAALTELDREAAPLARARAALAPWLWLDASLGSLGRSTRTASVALLGDEDAMRTFRSALEGQSLAAESMVSEGAVLVIAHKGDIEAVRREAEAAGLEEVALPPGEATPRAELERIEAQESSLEERRRETGDKIRSLSRLYGDVLALVESLENAVTRVEARQQYGATRRAVFIEGWVRADRLAELSAALAPFEAVDVCLTDPAPDEEPPVELSNPKWLQPFELLTRLYGMPDYRELDPTPVLALPFALFYGICVGDAGYGLLLILVGAFILKKLDVAENPRRFMRLMIYGGSSALVFGVMTGSYFAIETRLLPPFMRGAMVFDPLMQSEVFFILSVALGVLHVTLGVVLEAWDEARNGRLYQALAVQGTTLLTVVSGVIAVAGWIGSMIAGEVSGAVAVLYGASLKGLVIGAAGLVLFSGGFFEPLVEAFRATKGGSPWVDRIVGTVLAATMVGWSAGLVAGVGVVPVSAVLAAIAIALAVSRAGRRMVARGLLGLYNLYGMTGFVGDILSYARLMALGLASLLIGSTVNIMAGLVLSGVPSWPPAAGAGGMIRFVLLFAVAGVSGLLILVGGHIFNVAVNLLGAFVHPMRLQFVEFFSKFYEGAGRPFRPLAYTTGVLVLDEPET